MRLKKWVLGMLMILLGSSSLLFLLFKTSENNYNQQLLTQNISTFNVDHEPAIINESDYPTNLDVYLLDDINKARPDISTFSVNGEAEYNQLWQQRWWGWWNEVSNTTNPTPLKSLNIPFATKTIINDKPTDNFYFNWSEFKKDNLTVEGSYQISAVDTNYGKFKMDHDTSSIYLKQRTIPKIEANINEQAGMNKYIVKANPNSSFQTFDNFAFYTKVSNVQNIINNLANDFYSKSQTSNSADWPHANYAYYYHLPNNFGEGYTSSWHAFGGRHAVQAYTLFSRLKDETIEALKEKLIGALVVDKELFDKLVSVQLDKLQFSDNKDKTWNAVTIRNNTKNVLGFSKYFWWLKTLDKAAEILDKINEEIIKPASGNTINIFSPLNNPNLVNDIFATLVWDSTKTPYKMTDIRILVNEINKLAFPDFDTLRQYSEQYLLRPSDGFHTFPIGNGEFKTILTKMVDVFTIQNMEHLRKWTLKDWSKLYDGLINIFRSYNLVITTEVWDTNQHKWNPVRELDGNGLENNVKEIIVWDGEKGQWNYDFINDIGIDFIEQNILEFKIKEYRVVPSTHKSSSNNAAIFGLDNLTASKNQDFSVRIKYRYNAMPFDLLVLSSKYDPKWAKCLSVFSDKTINQFVYMDNGSKVEVDENGNEIKKEWYVNDFVKTSLYNPKKIILKSLNDNIRAYVMNIPHWDNGYNGYPIFGDVLSGIGIGDLNETFGFEEKQPFFNLDSWIQALSNFRIKVDSEHQRYPIYASSYKNNVVYAIATIPNWKFQDGTYGDFDAIARKILSNEIKIDKSNKDFLPDYQFFGMSEIEPYTRYTNNGEWDNKGYFLLKLNVSQSSMFSNSPYTAHASYGVKNWEDKKGPKYGDVYAQYLQPPNKDAKLPYEKAGLMQLLMAQNEDGSGRYWINPIKTVVEQNFLSTTTYELNDWQLNVDLLMRDLALNNVTQIKYRTLLNNVKNWIRYSHKFSKEDVTKYIALINKSERKTVASALKWYLENGMIELEIIRWDFQLFETLKFDDLFKNLLNFYDYKFDDLFTNKSILVCGENTKETRLIPNSDYFNNDFGVDNFANNIKVITTEENNYRFVNKNTNEEGNVKVRIPNKMLIDMIESNHFHLPSNLEDKNYNPYSQSYIDLRYIPFAMQSAYGIFYNLDTRTNYKNRKLVKQNERKETNILNMIYVTVLPIASLLIIGAGAVCFAWLKKRKF